MPRNPSHRVVASLVVFALTLGVALWVARPFSAAAVSFDAQATVLYFERLIAGERLEAPLTTTPKPILTVVYGGIHAVTGDWQAIVWATLLALAASAALAWALAYRAAGPVAALPVGLAVGLAGPLVEDAALGGAVPWALLGWLLATAALTAARPRYLVAGVALALATLARLETFVVIASVAAILAWERTPLWPAVLPRPRRSRGPWLMVGVACLALPALLVHDWLLTGDPFFWATVSARYTETFRETGTVMGPLERVRWLAVRYLRAWPLVVLAVPGLLVLVRQRRWVEIAGLAALGPGIGGFLVLLAARGIYAPERYAAPIDVALLVAAAVGFAWLVDAVAGRRFGVATARLSIVAVAVAVVVAVAAGSRIGPFDPGLARRIDTLRTLGENVARVLPDLAPAAERRARVFVPTPVRPRVAVDLGVPLTSVGALSIGALDPGRDLFESGHVVYHDRHGDVPTDGYGLLEADGEIAFDEDLLVPLTIDAGRGYWVYAVERRTEPAVASP